MGRDGCGEVGWAGCGKIRLRGYTMSSSRHVLNHHRHHPHHLHQWHTCFFRLWLRSVQFVFRFRVIRKSSNSRTPYPMPHTSYPLPATPDPIPPTQYPIALPAKACALVGLPLACSYERSFVLNTGYTHIQHTDHVRDGREKGERNYSNRT